MEVTLQNTSRGQVQKFKYFPSTDRTSAVESREANMESAMDIDQAYADVVHEADEPLPLHKRMKGKVCQDVFLFGWSLTRKQTQNDYLREWKARRDDHLHVMLEAEAPATNMNCGDCGRQNALIRCLDCSASPLFCRSCCRISHKRLHTHRVQCWNGKYFRTSALWETGLVCNLGHGGLPCPGLALAEEEENTRQDTEWEGYLNDRPTRLSVPPAALGDKPTAPPGHTLHSSGRTDNSPPPAYDAAAMEEDFIALPDLDMRMNAAVEDIFEDEDAAPDDDESYDSDGIDGVEDHEVPDGDIVNDKDDRDDHFTRENYQRMQGIGTPPHPNTEDALGNPFVTIVETNGVHHLPIHYCICPSAGPHDEQLFAAKLFPTSFSSIKTVFTFNVLDDFRLTNLSCKSSCYQYYLKLRRLTSPAFPNSVPNRYHELLRVSRQWRNLELRKSFGFGHHDNPPQRGEMGHGCASCPQPGINLPDDWKSDPHQLVTLIIETFRELMPLMTQERYLQDLSVLMEISRQIT